MAVFCHSLINKEAPPSIALDEASNLVKLGQAPDVGSSLAQTPTSSNPPSRSQRRINVDRVSFDGGQAQLVCLELVHREIHDRFSSSSGPNRVGTGATFKADSYSRCFNQFDRKTDCFDGGFGMGNSPVEVRFLINSGRRAWFKSMRPTFKAACGTQTRMLEGFNLRSQIWKNVCTIDITMIYLLVTKRLSMLLLQVCLIVLGGKHVLSIDTKLMFQYIWQKPRPVLVTLNQIQALSTPDNLVGGTGNSEPARSIIGPNLPVMGELCLN